MPLDVSHLEPCRARRSRRRVSALLVVAFTGLGGLAACGDTSSGPQIDCDWLAGHIFVELQPTPSGTFASYTIDVGDSIQLGASLRRVDAAVPAFNPQLGWYCVPTATSPVSGVVNLTTTDPDLVRLAAQGWVHGLSPGLAAVGASSTDPPATTDVGVLVRAP